MFDRVTEFFRLESAGGLTLIAMAVLALVLSNSPLASGYEALLHAPVEVRIGALFIGKPLLLWINDGLMAVFFLLVGLEIKREMTEGNLSRSGSLALPALAALGGMMVPAGIYASWNWGSPHTLDGWAIPAATDIAFALGVLSLLGSRVPMSLKVFLTAVAVLDDLGAIVIIALFYTTDLNVVSLGFAGCCLAALIALNRFGVTHVAAYLLIGIVLWVSVLKSGVHATLAGVAIAFAIPVRGRDGGPSPAGGLEHQLHPWVAFGILPLFAFANAGVSLHGVTLATLQHPVTMGIATGLVFGKTVGVFGFGWLAIRCGLSALPPGSTWASFFGVCVLCGIGFTMSLFIGTLAFEEKSAELSVAVRLGVLCGSALCAIAGYSLLRALAAPAVK